MKLTRQQIEAVRIPDSAFVEACPGSGKTRTITAKLMHLVDVIGHTPRKIACITYTNAAVHEIERRIRRYGLSTDESICQIATIHSFCLRNIFGPYCWKLPAFQDGFELLPPDADEYLEIAESVYSEYDSDFAWAVQNAFKGVRHEHTGSILVESPLDEEIASKFLQKLESKRIITFNTLLYYSYRLLADHSEISKGVASKFNWILMDEFQDTTALQCELLNQVTRFGSTKFFLVGDPNQSIYAFTGANPDLMYDFSVGIRAKSDLILDRNWRSSKKIVNDAEKIFRRQDPMVAVGPHRDSGFTPKVVHARDPFDGISRHFLPQLHESDIPYGDAAILAPQRWVLHKIAKQLITREVPIVGVGTRPYNSNKYTFARLLETLCAAASSAQPISMNPVHRELIAFLTDFTGHSYSELHSFAGRKLVVRLVNSLSRTIVLDAPAVTWISTAIDEMVSAFRSEELISSIDAERLVKSVSALICDISSNNDIHLTVRGLSSYANFSDSLKLLTIHGAKGLEFDAVALIDLHERRIPHNSINTTTNCIERQRILEESKRLFYVGITRAKQILMYFTDSSDSRNQPSRLLNLL